MLATVLSYSDSSDDYINTAVIAHDGASPQSSAYIEIVCALMILTNCNVNGCFGML